MLERHQGSATYIKVSRKLEEHFLPLLEKTSVIYCKSRRVNIPFSSQQIAKGLWFIKVSGGRIHVEKTSRKTWKITKVKRRKMGPSVKELAEMIEDYLDAELGAISTIYVKSRYMDLPLTSSQIGKGLAYIGKNSKSFNTEKTSNCGVWTITRRD